MNSDSSPYSHIQSCRNQLSVFHGVGNFLIHLYFGLDPSIKSFEGKYEEKGVSHFAISVQATNDDFEKLMKILTKRQVKHLIFIHYFDTQIITGSSSITIIP